MSLSSILYVCTVASLFPAIFSQKSSMSRHQLELKEHYEHLAMIAGFECDHPQPRLLSVHELLSESQLQGKAYFPEVTVMHRCDRHVGSCNDGFHKCGPTHATTVQMPFKATYLEDMGQHTKGEWEMEYHPMENHTSCGCLKYEELPKPTKTTVHYHYVEPSLFPSQSFLPLDPTNQKAKGNESSYDVPLYQFNSSTQQPPTNESDQEQESSSQQYYSRPSFDVTTKAEEDVDRPKPQEESNYPCPTCTDSQVFPGYPGYSASESPTTNEVRSSSTSPKLPSYADNSKDFEATTLTEDLIRFGAVDSPSYNLNQ